MTKKNKTKNLLFLELAKPDKSGKSRWIKVTEFVGDHAVLAFGNGASWARKESTLAKKYIVEFDKNITPGNSIDAIRLNGLTNNKFSQYIRPDIKKEISSRKCVVLGTSNPEVDHKNGMKNNPRIMTNENQKLSDFQPLSRAANDAKRQCCKECIRTGLRFDAKKLGYPISYYHGKAIHNHEKDACIGCFWYDPIEFRKNLKKAQIINKYD